MKRKHNENFSNSDIREMLISLAEPDYQRFSSSLIPNIPAKTILGVRLPKLRELAKQIVKTDWRSWLLGASDESFEEIMLQGMVIGYGKAKLEETFSYTDRFLKKIDNWSICDSFCAGLKTAKTHPKEWWAHIQPYFQDEREYTIRFAVVMTLQYFVNSIYQKEAFRLLEQIKSEAYYVKMAIAWALSAYYIKYPEDTIYFLTHSSIEKTIYQMAIQKMIESKKVREEEKKYLRILKLKK